MFVPIGGSRVDFRSLANNLAKHGYDFNKLCDDHQITPDTYTAYFSAIEMLSGGHIVPRKIFEEATHLYKHLHLTFLYTLDIRVLSQIALKTDLCFTSYHLEDNKQIGICSGTLKQWYEAIIEGHTIYADDATYLKLFNGILSIFEMMGLGSIFSGFNRRKVEHNLFVFDS